MQIGAHKSRRYCLCHLRELVQNSHHPDLRRMYQGGPRAVVDDTISMDSADSSGSDAESDTDADIDAVAAAPPGVTNTLLPVAAPAVTGPV